PPTPFAAACPVSARPTRPAGVGSSFPVPLTHLSPGVPATHEDDGNAAARAEAAAAGASHLVYLGIGTGLAGGIVADGQVVAGACGGAGEVGHLPVAGSASDPPCSCGQVGCLQATVSGKVIGERVARRTWGR